MTDYCVDCDEKLEPLDEPQTCYFTGQGPCGDCRDPRTGKPPYEGGCFRPRLCKLCQERADLLRWKAEAIVLLNEWDEVWEALGEPGPLGASKAKNVLRYIEENL